MRAEDAGWNELHALIDSLRTEEAERTGYYAEGWSASDLLGHIGSWLAAAGAVLERIRSGTYRREDIDIDAWNERFLEAMKGTPFRDVKAQAVASRARMLQEWAQLDEVTPDAAFWIEKSGAEHYAEHLPRLREWVAELHPSQA
ncbi:MAG TPA: DinB family protein [Actinomycetota bacterium]